MALSDIIGLENSICRAVLCALTASDALILVNSEVGQALANACGANLVHNVSNVLIAEELQRGKHGVGSSLSKAAKRVFLNIIAKCLELT